MENVGRRAGEDRGCAAILTERLSDGKAPMLNEVRSQAEYQRIRCVWLCITLDLRRQQSSRRTGLESQFRAPRVGRSGQSSKISRDQLGGSDHGKCTMKLGRPVHHSVIHPAFHR